MKRKPNGYWNYFNCKEEAKKYDMRSHFCKNSGGAYASARINGWLDEICSHMIIVGDKYRRCIYVYEFDDNSAYIGLTYNLKERHRTHNIRGTIFEKLKNTKYTLIKLTDYINIKEAINKESEYVEKYKKNNWCVLNISKTGSVGAISIWSFEKCKNEAKKYKTRYDFQKKSSGSYSMAWKSGWLDDICSHMEKLKGIWTEKENCKKEALRYKNKRDFRKYNVSAYSSSLKNGWLDEICSHMKPLVKRDVWTLEKCEEEAKKYNNLKDFYTNSTYVYKLSRKKGWISKITKHFNKNDRIKIE